MSSPPRNVDATRPHVALGGAHERGEGRYAVRGVASYAAGGLGIGGQVGAELTSARRRV